MTFWQNDMFIGHKVQMHDYIEYSSVEDNPCTDHCPLILLLRKGLHYIETLLNIGSLHYSRIIFFVLGSASNDPSKFVVGEDAACPSMNRNAYCNGPLEPGLSFM